MNTKIMEKESILHAVYLEFLVSFHEEVTSYVNKAIKFIEVTRMDLFDDVTQNCDFLCFSLKQKFVSMNRFIVPNLVYL